MADIAAQCPHCDLQFDVPRSMHGGIASCPDCGRTVPLQGGPEPLYWIFVGLSVLLILGIGIGLALIQPIVGLVVAIVGLAGVAIIAVSV